MLPRELLSDQHTIETPEQISLDLAVAGIGSRFLALALDTLIQVLVGLVTLLALALMAYTGLLSRIAALNNWVIAGVLLSGFLLYYGYFAIFEILWNGQTPGKRYVGIRVIKDSGRPLTAGETIGRNLMRIVDQIPAFYAVGIIAALLNRKHQRLGDLLVGAVLVRESSLAELKPLWRPLDADVPMSNRFVDTSGLTSEDLTLVDAFLARRHSLSEDVRGVMASQIVARLRAKLPEAMLFEGTSESILEALSYHKRSSRPA